jgi:hypothetical protein
VKPKNPQLEVVNSLATRLRVRAEAEFHREPMERAVGEYALDVYDAGNVSAFRALDTGGNRESEIVGDTLVRPWPIVRPVGDPCSWVESGGVEMFHECLSVFRREVGGHCDLLVVKETVS